MILIRMLAAAAIVAAALMLCAFALVCACAHRRWRVRRADCILVLGARVWPDGSLSRTLRARCDVAARAWRRRLAPRIILCGGRGADEPVSEAEAMAARLRALGVPEAALLLEMYSANTIENLRNARRIMDAHGMRSALLVTSDYHMTRAMWIARDMRIRACALPARAALSRAKRLRARAQESFSWALYILRKINNKTGIS